MKCKCGHETAIMLEGGWEWCHWCGRLIYDNPKEPLTPTWYDTPWYTRKREEGEEGEAVREWKCGFILVDGHWQMYATEDGRFRGDDFALLMLNALTIANSYPKENEERKQEESLGYDENGNEDRCSG